MAHAETRKGREGAELAAHRVASLTDTSGPHMNNRKGGGKGAKGAQEYERTRASRRVNGQKK